MRTGPAGHSGSWLCAVCCILRLGAVCSRPAAVPAAALVVRDDELASGVAVRGEAVAGRMCGGTETENGAGGRRGARRAAGHWLGCSRFWQEAGGTGLNREPKQAPVADRFSTDAGHPLLCSLLSSTIADVDAAVVVTVPPVELSTEPIMQPEDLAATPNCRVRFDTECVLIPEPISPSRMPRLLKKSYSLPLWRKKPSSATDEQQPTSPNDDPRSRFSFSRARSTSRDQNDPGRLALVPCIVDHDHPHQRRARRPSLPIAPRLDVVTVPLRDCCLRCHPVMEEALSEGPAWQEKFSKAARRRRNSSADSYPVHHRRVNEDLPGFESVLNVDEVSKRRRTRDAEAAEASALPMNISLNDPEDTDLCLLPSLTRQKLHIATNALPTQSPPSLKEEDEEDQLFPLPSPRRTPNGSPLPSPLPTPSSSTTNLAKTLGQRSVQNATGTTSGSLPAPTRLSPSMLLVVPSLTRADRVRGRCETEELVPELTRSPSSSPSASPDMSLLSSSPSTPVSHSLPKPIAFRRIDSSPPPPYSPSPAIASPNTSPQLGRRDRGGSISSPGTSWRKLHLAGSLLKAGADVLKGVNSMGGGVAV